MALVGALGRISVNVSSVPPQILGYTYNTMTTTILIIVSCVLLVLVILTMRMLIKEKTLATTLRVDTAQAQKELELGNASLERAETDIKRLQEQLKITEVESNQHHQHATKLKTELEITRTETEKKLNEWKEEREADQKRMEDAFAALSSKALKSNREDFDKHLQTWMKGSREQNTEDFQSRQKKIDEMVKPLKELLEKQGVAVHELEKKREGAYAKLGEQVKQIAEGNKNLNQETHKLVTALRRSEQRGQWGEMQLRNTVELAGMTKHCDYNEQVQTDDPKSKLRPDMIIHLPGDGVIVVDSKVALNAYLDALQPDADRNAAMKRHAKHVEQHYKGLSSKLYWKQFDRTPKLVVMFMPLESALVAALEVKPDLHADAMRNNVIIATPTLLVALLRAVAYGWQQEDIAANAREISATGRDLYDRLAVFTSHFEKVGKNLNRANVSYNDAVGSLERNLMPGARKLKNLHVTTEDVIETPLPIDVDIRPVTSTELKQLPGSDDEDYSHNT